MSGIMRTRSETTDFFGPPMEVWEIRRQGGTPTGLRIVVLCRIDDGALWAKIVRGDGRRGSLEIIRPEKAISQATLERWAKELESGKWTLTPAKSVARARAAKAAREAL